MVNEHAITYQDRLSVADLDYIIKKSNRLGKNGKEIINIHQIEDLEGKHLYFEVIGFKKIDE